MAEMASSLQKIYTPPFQRVVFGWKVGSLAGVTLLSTAPPQTI